MQKKLIGLTAVALLATFVSTASVRAAAEPPKAESSLTQHTLSIGGRSIRYTATAGTLLVRNEKDEPAAAIGYVAYVQRPTGEDGGDSSGAGRRPITFAYNGGPGSSSLWLHMGALGPRRIVTTDAGPTPPAPYRVIDNAYSILDKTDLVLIDPVGTGFSHAAGEGKDKDFWGVDPDIESISRFITQYVTDNDHWGSPKYLFGESYGTTRSAGVVDYLQTHANMAFNGVILLSVGIDFEAIYPIPGNDKSYPLALPSFAAAAWYHHALPRRPDRLEPFLAEVRAFALGDYASALLKGDALAAPERDAIAEKIHQYTGLSADYVKQAKLRVRPSQFAQELLRSQHLTLGILDGRFAGASLDPLSEDADYDPLSSAIGAPFTAAFLDYLHSDLKFGQGRTYTVLGDRISVLWDFRHHVPNLPFPLPVPDTSTDLIHALATNPHLRILTLSGYYDLATPFLAAESMMSHLLLEKEQRSRIEMKYFEAGHMMYLHEPSLKEMKEAVAAFYDATASHP